MAEPDTKKEYTSEDIRHIEEVPNDGVIDSKAGASSPDHYGTYPMRAPYTGRWEKLRFALNSPGPHPTC